MAKILQIQMFPYDTNSDLCERICRALKNRGHQVTIAFLKGRYDKKFLSKASSIHEFNFASSDLRGFRRIISLFFIYRFLKQQNFDLIIGHRFKPIHMQIFLAPFIPSPMVAVIHGEGDYDRSYRKRLIKKKGARISRFIAVSESVKAHLLSLHCGFNKENVVTIPNAVDTDEICRNFEQKVFSRNELGIKKSNFVFGTIGRLVPVKGHALLIEAFARISERYPDIELVIIGDGRDREALHDLIGRKCLSDRVHLAGWKDNPTRFLSAFDCYVFPSLSEGLPLGLLEGMCGSIPVIGSDIPAISSVLSGAGLLHESGNSQSISFCMERVLKMPTEERAALGKASFQKVKNEFSIGNFNKKWQLLVEGCLNI